jgi:hypothetical protein
MVFKDGYLKPNNDWKQACVRFGSQRPRLVSRNRFCPWVQQNPVHPPRLGGQHLAIKDLFKQSDTFQGPNTAFMPVGGPETKRLSSGDQMSA